MSPLAIALLMILGAVLFCICAAVVYAAKASLEESRDQRRGNVVRRISR